MAARRLILWLALAAGLLLPSACAEPGLSIDTTPAGRPTAEPTPTLAAGALPGRPPTPPIMGPAASTSSPAAAGPVVTDEPVATPTSALPPTATPRPAERLALAAEHLATENYAAAIEQLTAALAAGQLPAAQEQAARLSLARAQLGEGDFAAAANTLADLLGPAAESARPATAVPGPPPAAPATVGDEAYFLLGAAEAGRGDCAAAVAAYELYLAANPALAAYVQQRIAACHLKLDDRDAAVAAYEAAAAADALPIVRLGNHLQLARIYEEDGDLEAALAEYEAILAFAQTEQTRGQVTYEAGRIEVAAGNVDAGHARYLEAIERYPRARESYLALVALVDAGVAVDDFQRGLVDYYAEAYEPAVEAFNRYVAGNPVHREDTHLYLAWSYERLGNVDAALAEVDEFIAASTPPAESAEALPEGANLAQGWIERGKLMARAGRYEPAVTSYLTYLELFPQGEEAPYAAWWAAALAERLGDVEQAIDHYVAMAEGYPAHQDAAEALFRAGYLARDAGDEPRGSALLAQAAEGYTNHDYGAAALGWLIRSLPEEEATPYVELAAGLTGEGFYQLRARHLATDTVPFAPAEAIELVPTAADQEAAEAWLRESLGLDAATNVRDLSPELAEDGRLVRGAALWRVGLRAEGKRELESLREAYQGDGLHSYQLALFFRDLGLYRSSLLAATSVLRQAGLTVFEAPRFLGQLAYPAYYADLILAEAAFYGYDPLLQLALVRQESLFESFATSTAVARGLSQVIPDTGAYIAAQLGWPDYQVEDLYRPYVGIAFGAYYLDQQLEAFDGYEPAALAAYNGGPGNAARWYREAGEDLDRFVQTIDFAETRQYVQRIYAGQAIYRYLYEVPAE